MPPGIGYGKKSKPKAKKLKKGDAMKNLLASHIRDRKFKKGKK